MTAQSKTTEFKTWQAVRDEVHRRIHARIWTPGQVIPTEAELAAEFGCARATVNRALQALAETGLVDRRRKAGTRVATHPTGRATLEIAVIRKEIEGRGQRYGYALLERSETLAPPHLRAVMMLDPDQRLLHLRAIHLADAKPYVIEDRWINTGAVPKALAADFSKLSANEWLLQHAPYTHGDITFSAAVASGADQNALGAPESSALFVIERTTWDRQVAITSVRLAFAPGYRMSTSI